MLRDIMEMLSRLLSVFRRTKLDQDFDEEFAAHIDMLTEQNERRGLPHDEARRQAILQMGGRNATQNLHREERGLPPVERFLETLQSLARDLMHATRSLSKARAFTFVCVVSLGIGMAPVIAVPYLTRIAQKLPPPGGNAEGLVELILPANGPRQVTDEWSYADFIDVRDADTGLALAGWTAGESETAFLTASGDPETVSTLFVSANYFDVMDVKLVRGPGFDTTVETRQTPEPVVVVAYEFWQNRLNADPDIIGKTLMLEDTPHVVVGIVPEGFFDYYGPAEGIAVPLERHPYFMANDNFHSDRTNEWVHVYGRLSSGVSIEQANAAVAALTSRLAQEHPSTNEFKVGSVEPYNAFGGAAGGGAMTAFQALMFGLTGLLLVVICLNISGMMQVRSAMRERELSVRQAIGASRTRLVRYVLCEAVVLSVVAGSLAAFVLFNFPHVLSWLIEIPIPPDIREALRPDVVMLAVCVGVCFVTSLVFGLLPALRFSRPVIITSLKDDAGVGGLRAGRFYRWTAALQVAVAVPLLVVSGIQVERVRATATADLGFTSDNLYAAPLVVRADTPERRDFLIRSVRDNLERADGVSSVAVATGLPLDFAGQLSTVSLPADRDTGESLSAQVTRVSDDYLNTMEIPLLRGRGITAEDAAGTELVTVISRSLADRLFPNTEGVGEQLAISEENAPPQLLTVVGVTEDFVTWQMTTAREQLLIPLAQHPARRVFFIVRSAPGEQSMRVTAAFENTIREVNPDFRAAHVITGNDLRERSIEDFIGQGAVAAGIGGIVLALAALGIYGIVGLMVATRTREIAVRVALGASRSNVMRMILVDVVKLVTPGVVGGLILSMAVFRTEFAARGFGVTVSGLESLGYIFGAAVAILVALIAGFAPARRASSVAPMVAMRTE